VKSKTNLIVNDVFEPYLNNNSRVQIFYGGSGSGKSVFISQRAVLDLLEGNRNYLVCRAVGKTVRRSVMNEIRKVIADADLLGTEVLAAFQFDDDNETRKLGYIGAKRYTRLTITPVANASAAVLCAVAILGNPMIAPTVNPPV